MKYQNYFKNVMKKIESKTIYLLAALLPNAIMAQSEVWGKLTTEASAGKAASRSIGQDISAGALFIGAIFVVYSLAENKNNAKAYAIMWIVGLIFYFLMFDLVE